MVTVSQFAQPFASTIFTVYVVDAAGVETGFEILGLLSVPAGAQLYVVPLDELRVTLKPGQTHPGFGPALARGRAFTTT